MEEKKPHEFKINIDTVHSDSFIREEKKDIRIEKLNQKITILSIIFPCIIVILLLIIYFDIKNKITGVHDSGAMEVKNLSKNIDKKTTELSSLYSKIEESFEKRTSALKTEFQNSVKDIKEAKAEKTEVANSIAEINRQISAVRNDLSAVSNKVKGMEAGLSQKITDITKSLGKIENDLAKLHSDIAGISGSKADKKDIEASVRNEQKRYQNDLNRLAGDVEDKIDSIRRQIGEIEKKTVKMTLPAAQQPKTENTGKPAVSKGAASQPGKIVEQDLQ
jgi:chromosome segregation ATPase